MNSIFCQFSVNSSLKSKTPFLESSFNHSYDCSGLMSKDDFSKLASPYLPESKLEEFTENTFKLFDEDQDGLLDFGEFALAALAIETKDSRERLVWTFDRIFDQASGACASAQEAIISNQSKLLKTRECVG